MTSKEAIEELKVVLKSNTGTKNYADIFEDNLLKPIEKDLEVLEMLKPIIKACFKIKDAGFDIGYLCSTIKTKRILKEWLE